MPVTDTLGLKSQETSRSLSRSLGIWPFLDQPTPLSLTFIHRTSPSDDTQKQDYTIEWVDVERVLAKTKSDVFVIFDCCHAGLLCRPANRGSDRCFQYMGACSPYQRTKRAGRASFTTAMIWALERLSSKPGFPSSELLMTITEAPNFPRDQYPELYGGRFEPSAEYIYIAPTPLPNESIQVPLGRYRNVPAEEEKKQQEYLDLRFHFDSPISREALVRTADTLKRQMKIKKLECRRVTFRGKYSAAEWAASAFLDRIRHKRNVTANQPTPTAPTFMLQGPLTSDETAPPALRLDTIPRTPSPSGPSSGVLSPWIRSEEHGGRPEQKSAGRELERRSSTDAETARGNSIDDHSAQKRKHTTEGEKDMAEDDNQPKGSKRQKSDGRVAGEDGLRESSELRRRSTRRSRGKASTSA